MFTENILDHGTFPFARTTCPYNHKNDILFDILQFQKQAAVLRSIRYGRAHQYVYNVWDCYTFYCINYYQHHPQYVMMILRISILLI